MKHQPRIISVLVAMMLSFSLSTLVIHPSHSISVTLSEEDMKIYAQAFLASYNKELEENFRPQFREFFPFHADYPYYVNATISNVHGAALEFAPWNQEVLESKTINTRIESAVFKDVNLNITSLNDGEGYTVVIYTGPPTFDAFITVGSFSHVTFSDIIVITNQARFIDVADGGELFLSNVIVDERYFHTMVMRGSNELSAWTAQEAENDAHSFFEIDLYRAFNRSEEVREYIAYPELSQLLEQIVWKHLHADEIGYDLFAFREDLAKVQEIARDKYHVSTEFVDELLDYLEKIAMTPTSLPPWEVAPWSWILGGLVSLMLAAVVGTIFKRWSATKKKSKKKRSKRKKSTH